MSLAQIRQRLELILDFLQPHWEFINCHMVNYLTDKHWDHFIPPRMRSEVQNIIQVRKCIETVFWESTNTQILSSNDFPEFVNFVNASVALHLNNFDDILTTSNHLYKRFDKVHIKEAELSIKEFMSPKKKHEVETTASLINSLIINYNKDNSNTNIFIIDAGDGKGYLSSRLALQYSYRVLGIDANASNTENALERSKKLQRAWNGLTTRAELESKGIKPPRRCKKPKCSRDAQISAANVENYKTTAKYITSDLDMIQLLKNCFSLNHPEVSEFKPTIFLTGLHTCGNLASTCLRVFHEQPNCKLLCNIGCCYHLLQEKYAKCEFYDNREIMNLQIEAGFPMSQFLKDKHTKLGRNARMLASQSIERTIAGRELPNIALFYRALLEVVLNEQSTTDLRKHTQVGKIRKFNDFSDYFRQCIDKVQLEYGDWCSNRKLTEFLIQYENDKYYLELFYLIRMCFAPILESLILLDRLLYLKELGYENSYLISIFDAVISPRHFAIVAIKD